MIGRNIFFNVSCEHFFISGSNATANSTEILIATLQTRIIVYLIDSSSTSNINLPDLMLLCKTNCNERSYLLFTRIMQEVTSNFSPLLSLEHNKAMMSVYQELLNRDGFNIQTSYQKNSSDIIETEIQSFL
jgi:hypothetical protein